MTGCATRSPAPSAPPISTDRDGPLPNPPPDLAKVPDALPRIEPVRSGGPNKPYEVGGDRYQPITGDATYAERGLASWYGRKFHGRPTASGEVYNMYAMTAAHATLPIPSYARVRNPANGKEVIVRINDRGPFHKGRIIDLSYTAALKLDVLNGVAPVEIERITYEDIRTGAWTRDRDTLSPDPKVPAETPVYAAATPSGAPDVTTTAQLRPPATPVAAQVPVPTPVTIAPAPVPATAATTASADAALKPIPITALPPGSDLPPPGQSKADAMAVATAGAIAAADPAAPVPALKIAAAQGFWLQFGAFSRLEGAEQLREQFTRGMEEIAPMLTIFKDKNLHRLQAGPFTSREDARAAADRVRSAMALTPILVERR